MAEAGDKPLVWLHGEVKTPPFSTEARRAAGLMLRLIQRGHTLAMPDSRPMPSIGPRCHELRVPDVLRKLAWRIVYRIDDDVILIGEVIAKKTQQTPQHVIDSCKNRFRKYDRATQK